MLIGDVWISPPMVDALCKQLGVHRTTVQRWLRKKTIPNAMYVLLDLLHNGSLARIHRAWDGWKLCPRDGVLIPPNGSRPFAPGHLYAMQLNYQRISALKSENRELRNRLRQTAIVGQRLEQANDKEAIGLRRRYHP